MKELYRYHGTWTFNFVESNNQQCISCNQKAKFVWGWEDPSAFQCLDHTIQTISCWLQREDNLSYMYTELGNIVKKIIKDNPEIGLEI